MAELESGVKAKKAVVCDLCEDFTKEMNPGAKNAEPMCVKACPHDAAHRVDALAFWLAVEGKMSIRVAGALVPADVQGVSLHRAELASKS
jgi:hypothetical protein